MQYFDRESFSSRKDQAIFRLNQLFDENEKRKQQLVITSPDGAKSLLVGVQPTGEFGIAIYDNNGDIKTLSKNEGLLTLPNRDTTIKGDDNVKVSKEDDEIKITIQDSFRIETLKSAYPVGSIYINRIDSREPGEIMNWNDSTWTKIEDAKITTKTGTADPVYNDVFMWERTG